MGSFRKARAAAAGETIGLLHAKCLLVAAENPAIIAHTSNALQQYRFQMVQAPDGQSALALARQQPCSNIPFQTP